MSKESEDLLHEALNRTITSIANDGEPDAEADKAIDDYLDLKLREAAEEAFKE
jgi:hypothetical protein